MPRWEAVLTKGLDQSVEKRVKRTGEPTELDNLEYSKAGKLEQRAAMRKVLTSTRRALRFWSNSEGMRALMECSTSNVAGNIPPADGAVYSRSPAGAWAPANLDGSDGTELANGVIPMVCDVQRRVLWSFPGRTHRSHSIAYYGNGIMCSAVCWLAEDESTWMMQAKFLRAADGSVLSELPPIAGYKAPRVCACANVYGWWIAAIDDATDSIVVFELPAQLPTTWPTATVLTTSDGTTYDMALPPGSAYAYLAFPDDTKAYWARVTVATKAITAVMLENDELYSIALSEDGQTVVWTNTGYDVWVTTFGGTTSPLWAAVSLGSYANMVLAVSAATTAAYAMVYYSAPVTTGAITQWWTSYVWVKLSDGSLSYIGPAGAAEKSALWGYRLKTAPAVVCTTDWRAVALCEIRLAHTSVNQAELQGVLMQWRYATWYPTPVAQLEPFQAEQTLPMFLDMQRSCNTALGYWLTPALETEWNTAGAVQHTDAVVYRWSPTGTELGTAAPENEPNAITVSGGLPVTLDAGGSVEQVPLAYPVLKLTANGTTGDLSGTYYYRAVYEIADQSGRRGLSAPSWEFSVSAGTASASISVDVPVLYATRLSRKRSARALVYRAQAGELYQLAGAINLVRETTTAMTTGFATLTDTTSSSVLSTRDYLYTEGGEQPRFCPPYSTAVCSHKGRMFSASGRRVYFSHVMVPGELPQWTSTQFESVPGNVRGLASVGEVLVIFTSDPPQIFYLAGDGPDRLGTGQFSPVRLVVGDVGLSSKWGGQSSVVAAGAHVYFRSDRGIERLSQAGLARTGSSEIISGKITDWLDETPVVLDAVHMPESSRIIWCLAAETTGVGRKRRLVQWDYAFNAWSLISGNFDKCAGRVGRTGDSLVVAWDDYLDASSSHMGIYEGSAGSYTDLTNTTENITTALTMPIRPFGAGGWGRVRHYGILGEWRGDAIVTFRESYDAEGTYGAPVTHTVAGTSHAVGEEYWAWREGMARQRCAGLSVRITGSGAPAPTWTAIAADILPLTGSRRAGGGERT